MAKTKAAHKKPTFTEDDRVNARDAQTHPNHPKASRKGAKAKAAAKTAARTAKARPAKKVHHQPVKVSTHLAEMLGHSPRTRATAFQDVWAYIRKHKLQSPSNGRIIQPNAAFAKVFGKSDFDMMHISRKLGAHLSACV